MYCTYFGFREKPFNITPNPRFLYLSNNHKEAFAHLRYGIKRHAGFITITGEVGTGKTTVLRTFLDQLDDATHRTALIFNPCLTAIELLCTINREYGLPAANLDNAQLLDVLNSFLLEQSRAGRTVVLTIDEAQNLDPAVLEQIRLISNLETETDKLIQIVLVGQPELGHLLARPELRQIAQRIAVSYHLRALDADDTAAYIRHRLTVAGRTAATFTRGAIRRIYRYSGGSPRLINIACDRALLVGYTEETQEIDSSCVKMALAELKGAAPRFRQATRQQLTTAAIVLIAVIAVSLGIRFVREPAGRFGAESSPSPPLQASGRPLQPAAAPAGKAAQPPEQTAAANPVTSPHPLTALPSGPKTAFNAVAALWKAPAGSGKGATLQELAAGRGLSLAPLRGSLAILERIDAPAILELNVPGAGRRYLALIGMERNRLITAPSLPGGQGLSREELGKLWTGRAYVPWINHQKIPTSLTKGAGGTDVIHLQILLAGAGSLTSELSGAYDDDTDSALKAFQKSRGLSSDGKLNNITLFLLYRDGGEFATPHLTRGATRSTG